jgi:hypothetical protein
MGWCSGTKFLAHAQRESVIVLKNSQELIWPLAASNCWSFDSKVSFNAFFLFTEMVVSTKKEAVEEGEWERYLVMCMGRTILGGRIILTVSCSMPFLINR